MGKILSFKKLLLTIGALLIVGFSYYYFSSKQHEPLPEMTVQEKKARFISIMLPATKEIYTELLSRYTEVEKDLAAGNGDQYEALKKEYGASNDQALLQALKPHPISITLAQAAMESSWATSRFFREANNIFGVWSFDENDDRIAAGEKRGDKTIWLKKYSSVKASIRDYYRTLARGKAFVEFRKLNLNVKDPYALVKKLDKYSEKGALYGEELTSIIKFNKFYKHDV